MRNEPNLDRILAAALDSCRTDSARAQIEEIRHACDYGEPGYSLDDENRSIVLGNWNAVTAWQDGKSQTIDNTPERLGRILEELGYSVEWSDEWVEEHTTRDGKPICLAFRCSGDCYGWQPSYLLIDGVIYGSDTIHEHPEIELELCRGDSRHCVQVLDMGSNHEEWGFVRFPKKFASGLYGDQNSDPAKIAASLEKLGLERWVFTMDSVGQFDCHFSLWLDVEELGDIEPGALEIDSEGSDPASDLKRALASLPAIGTQGENRPSVTVSEIGEGGTVTTKHLTPRQFVEGC